MTIREDNDREKNEYLLNAKKFLKKTQTSFSIKWLRAGKYFDDDNDDRDIYTFMFIRGNREFKGTFGQSVACSFKYTAFTPKGVFKGNDLKELNKLTGCVLSRGQYKINEMFAVPNEYDVLSALQKYPVDSFEDFCADYGYDTDSRKAEKIYKLVQAEWHNVERIWSPDEIDKLLEIN